MKTIQWSEVKVGEVALEPQGSGEKHWWMLVMREEGNEFPFGITSVSELSFPRFSKTIPVLNKKFHLE